MNASEVCLREPTGFSGYPTLGDYTSPYSLYRHVVAAGVQFLRHYEWFWAANVMGALLWEPRASIAAGMDMDRGKGEALRDFGMNPTTLPSWQQGRTPILALHGKNGTQGTFLKMGTYFEAHQLGPLFTVNLSEGELTEADREVIDRKIEEIREICGDQPIDLLGYSRGAEIALYAALDQESYRIHEGYCYQTQAWTSWRPEVRRVVRMGSMMTEGEWNYLSPTMQESVWEIRGLDDIHMPEPSCAIHKVEVEGVGHVGLTSSPEVFEQLKVIFA
ncbi:MAG: hypothetical protein KDK64_02475 [Chlamydiia bacterium]|nr:hypothetical protein [Chlamydiia bacterium]